MTDYQEQRPDPDELLASIRKDEAQSRLGKIKIFFGMCAGVGKTYAMLKAARIDKSKGTDVVVGIVEAHGRSETEELLHGLEIIARKKFEYKGTILEEPDMDAIIARRPQLVLMDELAHSNAPGSRHLKRYQDVLELLDNGIDVYTTVNVQHIESRADTVAQITGIVIRESIPDEVFEKAGEIELVDITPDELLLRFSEGKVYAPEQSAEAIRNFFRMGNITALREMALRIVADRVDTQLRKYMQLKRIPGPWKSGMHLMAVIGPGEQSARLLRWAKNLAYTMGATLHALYVETPRRLNSEQHGQLSKNIKLARQLGAEFTATSGVDMVKTILSAARKENITHIILNKPSGWSPLLFYRLGNFVSRLIRVSGNIDVYILGSDTKEKQRFRRYFSFPAFTSGPAQYFLAGIITTLTALAFYPLQGVIGYQIVAFALLFMVSILAIFLGIGPILLSATLSAILWDFLFIQPRFTFSIRKLEDLLMFCVFFFIALLNGILTSRVRKQERLTREREERTHALYMLTRNLSRTSGISEVISVSTKAINKYFHTTCGFILSSEKNGLDLSREPELHFRLTSAEKSIAHWVFQHSKSAGKFTDTLPSADYTFYPMVGTRLKPGVIILRPEKALTGEEELFWDTFRAQITSAIEREFLNELARKSMLLDESDKLYKTLFNSISHELRIPVATIMGASDTLMSIDYDRQTFSRLCSDILLASERLNRLIENLLNMSRLETGRLTPHLDWHDAHDLANKVLNNLKNDLKPFDLKVIIAEDLPLVRIDFGLMEQVLQNLLINAVQYSAPGTSIRLKLYYDKPNFIVQVMDRGPGLPAGAIPFVFDKFYRVDGSAAGGTGLGLSIVRGFVEAHHGSVTVANRKNQGLLVTVKIPSDAPDLGLLNQEAEHA